MPLKLYLANLLLLALSLLVDRKVITALSAGLLASAGLIANVAPPDVTVAFAVTVYIKFTPAILNASPACGAEFKPSIIKLLPV